MELRGRNEGLDKKTLTPDSKGSRKIADRLCKGAQIRVGQRECSTEEGGLSERRKQR